MKIIKLIIALAFIVAVPGCEFFAPSPQPRDNPKDPDRVGDTSSPAIIAIFPVDDAVDVSPAVQLIVTFSESMDTPVTEAALSVSAGTAAAGTFAWSPDGTELTFSPAGGLLFYDTYVLSLSGETADSAGNTLGSGYTINFATGGAAGVADETFGIAGYVVDDSAAFGDGDDYGFGITIAPDGKVLVTGGSYSGSNDIDMTVWRFNADGSADLTFGTGGVFSHNGAAGGAGVDYGEEVVVDPDGNIVIVGESTNTSGDFDMALWRLNSDGTLDTTFSADGFFTHDDAAGGTAGDDYAEGLALTADGDIYAAGTSFYAETLDYDMVVWKLDSTGNLDAGFGTGGIVVHKDAAGGNGWDFGRGVITDDSENIWISGASFNGASWDMIVWKFDSAGNIDHSFGGDMITGEDVANRAPDGTPDGFFYQNGTAAGDGLDSGYRLLRDNYGRIVVAGSSEVSEDNRDMALWRLNPNGTLDTDFGGQGWVVHPDAAGGGGNDFALDIELDPDDKIVAVGGSPADGVERELVVWRYNDDGTPDTVFGTDGAVVLTGIAGGDGDDIAYELAIDSGGKLFITGSSVNADGDSDMVLLKLR